jgi:TRAP-type C4-dicarboxylate transport system permease small subunit
VVAEALAMEQTTPAMGWQMGYVYLALPISGIFMVLFTIENLIETLMTSPGSLHEADAVGEVE